MYLILTRRRAASDWHPYGSRLFDNRKDAVSSVQVGLSIYLTNLFSIVEIDKDKLEKEAVGDTKYED